MTLPRNSPATASITPDVPEGLTLEAWRSRFARPGRPTVAILFYRAHWMANNVAPIDALIRRVEERGANPLAVFCYSLKDDPEREDGVPALFHDFLIDDRGGSRVDAVISTPQLYRRPAGRRHAHRSLGRSGRPARPARRPGPSGRALHLQSRGLGKQQRGLTPRDTAMNVVLPEFDGRIHTIAVSFKEESGRDERLGTAIKAYVPVADRVDLGRPARVEPRPAPQDTNADKKVAILFGNYPTKNARIGKRRWPRHPGVLS